MNVKVVDGMYRNASLDEIEPQDILLRFHRVCIEMIENDQKMTSDENYVLPSDKVEIFTTDTFKMLIALGKELGFKNFVVNSNEKSNVYLNTEFSVSRNRHIFHLVMYYTHGQLYIDGKVVMFISPMDLYEPKAFIKHIKGLMKQETMA